MTRWWLKLSIKSLLLSWQTAMLTFPQQVTDTATVLSPKACAACLSVPNATENRKEDPETPRVLFQDDHLVCRHLP